MTEYRAQIDNAAARRAADLAKLQREDGSRRYSEAEHAERVQAIESCFGEEVDALRGQLQAEISEAETRFQRLEASDPLDDLSPDELSAAGARAEFVREEVQRLGAEDLRTRLEAVSASSDKPLQSVYYHYLRSRVGEQPALKIVLADEIAALEEKLGRGPALREARAELERLRETHEYAGLKRQGHSSILQRHLDREYGTLDAVARR